MAHLRSWVVSPLNRESLEHSARTAVAVIASLLVARVFRLPETYWAAITTLIVMQSTLGAALTISGQRLAGTAVGAVAGAFLVTYFGPSVIAFGAGVFVMGLICAMLHLDRAAYRFAGITLAIIMLVVRDKPAWVIAAHRFLDVSVGIVVALVMTALWPEHPRATPASP
jgi:uncharacterized membrane protein YgaE (UPF0421/DUF939 family)